MWYDWVVKQSDLSNDKQELCFGPELALGQYDRALFGEIKFVAARNEGGKIARDSLVLTKSNG